MQSRSVKRAAKTGDSSSDEREPGDSSSDESEGEYLKIANAFAAKREAAKERAAEYVRRSFKADQAQGSKATQADQAAEVSAGGHAEAKGSRPAAAAAAADGRRFQFLGFDAWARWRRSFRGGRGEFAGARFEFFGFGAWAKK